MSESNILDYTTAFTEERNDINEDYMNLLWGVLQTDFFSNVKEHCKFCSSLMDVVYDDVYGEDSLSSWIHRIYSCPMCGWWYELDQYETYIGEGDSLARTENTFALLREYDIGSLELPISTLRSALLKNEMLMYSINPTKMEQLVGSIYKDFFDCEVIHLGKSGDGGIDLLLIDGNVQHIIQVKRRTSPKAVEGVEVIRELIGAMVLESHRNGIFVTTANRFTRPAKQAAEKARELDIVNKIELIDMHRFVDILKLTNDKTEMPWESYRKQRSRLWNKQPNNSFNRSAG